MSDNPTPELPVRRKIRSAALSSGPMDNRVVRVWRQVAARALKASVGMNVQVAEAKARPVPADELADLLLPGEMSALMENEAGDIGLVLVSPGIIAALVEMQTIGRVSDRQVETRDPTPVDGALVGPSIDRILASAGAALAENGLRDPVTDFRFAMLTEADTPPTLAMADLLHSCMTLDVQIEGGRKQGMLRFVIPDTGASEDHKAASRADWQDKISSAVLASDVTVEARLGRLRMPIQDVMRLQPGDRLALAADDLRRVRLVVGRGDLASRAKLGQSNGFRAVKIVGDDSTEGDPVWSQAQIDGQGID